MREFYNGQPVVVRWWTGRGYKTIHTTIDCCGAPRFGWVCVSGWSGVAGPVSVRVENVDEPPGARPSAGVG